MVEHIWSLACKSSIVNSDNNSMSILDILEGVNVETSDPSAFKDLSGENPIGISLPHEIVSYLHREDGSRIETVDLHITLHDDKDVMLIETTQQVKFAKEIRNMRTRVQNLGFPVSGSGRYVYKIFIDGDSQEKHHVGSIPIDVNIQTVPEK